MSAGARAYGAASPQPAAAGAAGAAQALNHFSNVAFSAVVSFSTGVVRVMLWYGM
jgi:hypothetical protein